MTNAFDCPPDVTEEELERVQRAEQRTREQLNVYRIPLWRLAQTAVSGRAIPFDELHQQDRWLALPELLLALTAAAPRSAGPVADHPLAQHWPIVDEASRPQPAGRPAIKSM